MTPCWLAEVWLEVALAIHLWARLRSKSLPSKCTYLISYSPEPYLAPHPEARLERNPHSGTQLGQPTGDIKVRCLFQSSDPALQNPNKALALKHGEKISPRFVTGWAQRRGLPPTEADPVASHVASLGGQTFATNCDQKSEKTQLWFHLECQVIPT